MYNIKYDSLLQEQQTAWITRGWTAVPDWRSVWKQIFRFAQNNTGLKKKYNWKMSWFRIFSINEVSPEDDTSFAKSRIILLR